jgi:hypothetical protein
LRLDVLDSTDRGAERILYVVTRCSISGVLRPVYCQMTVTTGISISGKMSVGIERNAVTPKNRISSANT